MQALRTQWYDIYKEQDAICNNVFQAGGHWGTLLGTALWRVVLRMCWECVDSWWGFTLVAFGTLRSRRASITAAEIAIGVTRVTVAAILQALPGLGIALSGGDKDFYQLLEVPHLTAISPAYKRPLCSLQHSKHRYPGGALIRDPHDPHDPLG